MDRVKRIWYLSPMRAAKVQAVSQEEPSGRKADPWPLWMAGHAQLKFVMTECSKTQIHLMGLTLFQEKHPFTWKAWSLKSLDSISLQSVYISI